MVEKTSAVIGQRGLEKRAGSSRKLLSRKARQKVLVTSEISLESCFPQASTVTGPPIAAEAQTGGVQQSGPADGAAVTPPRSPKASLKLRPGDIAPNAGTIVAAIVRLVVERGELSRPELIALMSDATLAHPKARPAEKGWSQGYVAGAIRSGFLAVASEPSNADASQVPIEEVQPC